jgi:monoterpene epsilon-lactone hydrolase
MQPNASIPWLDVHPATPGDADAAAALRSVVAPMKGKFEGTAGRGMFNDIMERVRVPDGVIFESGVVGGISGWWAKPDGALRGAAILHIHGGWFHWGTAKAFRKFAGHIARNAGADVFVPDYRLAPEHPFPAAAKDVEACYCGLVHEGITRIALTGDSAGGNLALVVLAIASAQASIGGVAPVGAVVFSPVTDLALTGESYQTRAEVDPFFTKSQAAGLVQSYLGETDPNNPFASPLYDDLTGLPPIRVQVGDDEVLLDDSRRYIERAAAASVDARVDVWMGMPHGFVTNIGGFEAAAQALRESGAFLAERLGSRREHDMKTPELDQPGKSRTDVRGPSHEEIARRAHQLWEERGRAHGSDEEDWHRAEHELCHQAEEPVATPASLNETSV